MNTPEHPHVNTPVNTLNTPGEHHLREHIEKAGKSIFQGLSGCAHFS